MFPIDIPNGIEDAGYCYTGSNDPVGTGDVVVSGGSLGVCRDRHFFDFLTGHDPESEDGEGDEDEEGSEPGIPSFPEDLITGDPGGNAD